jgi:hypothetical protein
MFTEFVVNLRLGRGRVLRGIERDLAGADPELNSLFLSFTLRASGEKMPDAETKPHRLLARLRRQEDRHRAAKGPGTQPRTIR